MSLAARVGLVLSVLLWAKSGRKEKKEKPYPEGSQWETRRRWWAWGIVGRNPTVGPG